jgi:hypothetical protein
VAVVADCHEEVDAVGREGVPHVAVACNLTRDRYEQFFFSAFEGQVFPSCDSGSHACVFACVVSNRFFLQLTSIVSARGTPISSSDATSMMLYGKVGNLIFPCEFWASASARFLCAFRNTPALPHW